MTDEYVRVRDFEGAVALVTGAGSGLGRACAVEFAARGARVVVVDQDEASARSTCAAVEGSGGDALPVVADVADSGSVQEMVEETVRRFGRLDAAVNNAGIGGPFTSIADYPDVEFDRVVAVNLRGVFLCTKYECRQMRVQGSGAVVNVASSLGLVGGPANSGYVASKHGVVGLSRAAGLEFAATRIRVNALCPGLMRTAMTDAADPDLLAEQLKGQPAQRLAEPEEVAAAAVWLCSPQASFVMAHPMAVDGGYVAV